MNDRERYVEALLFGMPDKVPLHPGGPRESTLATWRMQGLPQEVNWYDYLLQTLHIPLTPANPRTTPGVSFKMIPTFEEKVLEHKDGHYIVQDWMGAITEISDQYDYTYIREARDFVTRKWHRFPVQSWEDWEQMQARYLPNGPGRFPADFEQRCDELSTRDYPLQITVNGPFWQMREWLGLENLCMLMITDPDLIADMCRFWQNFVHETMDGMLARVVPDVVWINEDMAYKAHSMISPAMAHHFLAPVYDNWVTLLKGKGCPVIALDSDGYIADLIPLWIEVGINCTGPVEVAAHNDIVEYRRLYGTKMAFTGGIDKRALAKGGQAMVDEITRVVPPLLKQGGFIPGCDHGVPPDISWPNFVEYTRLLAQLTGWL